jgi:hypothetical protein
MMLSSMRAATDTLTRFRAELAGEHAFAAIIDAGTSRSSSSMLLADWACRTVTALAFEAADAPTDAAAVRGAPALTPATAEAWERRKFFGGRQKLRVGGLAAAVAVVLADVKYGEPDKSRLESADARAPAAETTNVALEAWAAAHPELVAEIRNRLAKG